MRRAHANTPPKPDSERPAKARNKSKIEGGAAAEGASSASAAISDGMGSDFDMLTGYRLNLSMTRSRRRSCRRSGRSEASGTRLGLHNRQAHSFSFPR